MNPRMSPTLSLSMEAPSAADQRLLRDQRELTNALASFQAAIRDLSPKRRFARSPWGWLAGAFSMGLMMGLSIPRSTASR